MSQSVNKVILIGFLVVVVFCPESRVAWMKLETSTIAQVAKSVVLCVPILGTSVSYECVV
jgi:hypothetical protein